MKKPTLMQVLNHFENAKEVVCNFEPYAGNYELFKLVESINYDEPSKSYYCDSTKSNSDVMLWCGKTKEYAEIISYKEQIQPDPIPNDVLKIVEKYGVDRVITFVELIKK